VASFAKPFGFGDRVPQLDQRFARRHPHPAAGEGIVRRDLE